METLSTTRLTLYFVIFLCLFLNCFNDLRCYGQLLPDEEVQALQTISEKLQLKNFNFNQSFCSSGSVRNSTDKDRIVTNFICDPCNATFCHVTNILLKGQNLTGIVPDEFGNLSFLRQIDLTRNYLSGPIPVTFAKIPLTNLSLLGNRINGSIPKEIGNIATLEELILEDNDLEGTIPENLGNLSRLKRLLLSANNMTGTIPTQFGNLKNIVDIRIDGNRIFGKIPEMIGNWTNMTRLDIQGTLMSGPFPSNISAMKNMLELRIFNLNASAIEFPDLREMKQLERLILRNCGLTGPIPPYIGGFTKLKTLDLSHNMLTGEIPSTFQSLNLDYMFLNNNSLSGSVPSWVINNNQKPHDISYNNFTETSAGCEASSANVVASISPTASNSVYWCLKQDLACSSKAQHYSLFINCGGDKLNYSGNEYEEDKGKEGPAYFSPSADKEKWAYSSNGVYLNKADAPYKATNTFGLNVTDGEIYKTARLAPNSLIYYGLCLRQGGYTVRLHFAEIMYSDDQTFSSLGKRIFDVAIQGNVVLTDYNIAEKAKGVGKGIIEEFPDIHVSGSTLTIHLYWTGKGTTAIPDRGVYGPLISAISVTPNFDVSDGGLSAGAMAGIVIASCVAFIALLLVVLWKFGYIGNQDTRDKELAALELQTGYFTLRQIKQATSNFDPANKIGEGGFGPVYKGTLSDGAVIAVKQLSSKSKQGNREFVTEIGMISALQHPNLVKLYGCCIEGNQLLLVYEYMENNSLARALFGKEEQRLNLDWSTRKKICLGIAKGLTYLHEGRLKIVHRDIKATNVLLDKDLNAKISDFGLAKLDEEENTHISTRIAGTIGYMAPEYAMRGYLTDKADVYSFGIVALEIVSGKSNTNYRPKEEFVYLLDWAYVLQEQRSLLELVDPVLGTNYSQKEALTMLNIGLLCTNPSPTLRPAMSSVVSMLEGKIPIQAPLIKRSSPSEELMFKSFEMLSHDSQTNVSSVSHESHVKRSMSMDGPWIDSSISTQSEFINHSPTSRLIQDLHGVNSN